MNAHVVILLNFSHVKKNICSIQPRVSNPYKYQFSSEYHLICDHGCHFIITLSENPFIVAMMLVFLYCLSVVISFLVGFVSNRVIVLSQTLQLAPQVQTLHQVQARSGQLGNIWDGQSKKSVSSTTFHMHNLNYIALWTSKKCPVSNYCFLLYARRTFLL